MLCLQILWRFAWSIYYFYFDYIDRERGTFSNKGKISCCVRKTGICSWGSGNFEQTTSKGKRSVSGGVCIVFAFFVHETLNKKLLNKKSPYLYKGFSYSTNFLQGFYVVFYKQLSC